MYVYFSVLYLYNVSNTPLFIYKFSQSGESRGGTVNLTIYLLSRKTLYLIFYS